MAPETVSQEAVSKDDIAARHALATEAACEISGLVTLVHDRIDINPEGRALRAMLRRVERLSCIVLSAIDDDMASPESIREQLEERGAAHHG